MKTKLLNLLLVSVYFLTFAACPFAAGWCITSLCHIFMDWPVTEIQTPETPVETPADTRVKLFITGATNFVHEDDLYSCRHDLREKAWQKLD